MPKTVDTPYRVGRRAIERRSTLQVHLLVVVLPLLFVAGYCTGYIEFRIHEQRVMSTAREHLSTRSATAGTLPIAALPTQTELPMVTASPAAVTTSSANPSSKTTTPQTESSATSQVLQSSVPNNQPIVKLILSPSQLLKLK